MTLRSRSALRTRRTKRTTCAPSAAGAAAAGAGSTLRGAAWRTDRSGGVSGPGASRCVESISIQPSGSRRCARTRCRGCRAVSSMRSPASSRRAISMICALAIAVHQQIGLGIEQHRAAHLLRPVVKVRDAAQRCLDAADDDRHVAVGLARALRVHDHRAIGPLAALAAGRVGIVAAHAPVGGVAIDHRVHVAGGDAEEQPRRTQRAQRTRRCASPAAR